VIDSLRSRFTKKKDNQFNNKNRSFDKKKRFKQEENQNQNTSRFSQSFTTGKLYLSPKIITTKIEDITRSGRIKQIKVEDNFLDKGSHRTSISPKQNNKLKEKYMIRHKQSGFGSN
jgi:hypothetical protein